MRSTLHRHQGNFGGGRRVRREQPIGVEGYGHLVVLPDAARDLGDIRPSQQRIS